MQDKKFKIWLENKLKENPGQRYDPDGNSTRARASRGLLKEIIYQYKKYPKSAIYEIKQFDGWDTPIIYFINLLIIATISPIIPILHGYFSHKEAIKEYKQIFNKEKIKNAKS